MPAPQFPVPCATYKIKYFKCIKAEAKRFSFLFILLYNNDVIEYAGIIVR